MISLLNDPKKWDEALEDSYYPYISYKYGWLQSIGSCFPNLKPLPFAEINEKGQVEYICPCFHDAKRAEIISSPFLTPGFINKNTNPEEMLKKLVVYAKGEKCRKISLQIPPNFNYSDVLLSLGFRLVRKLSFYNIEIDGMESFDYYLKNFCSKARMCDVKAAWKKGVKLDVLQPAKEVLDRFYPFYSELGQRKDIEVFEKSFLDNLTQSLRENARYWIARVEDKDIGSALTFEFKDRIWGMLLQGGMDYRSYKTDPFLYVEIVRYGFEKNLKIIDLGTSPLDSPLGDFKRRTGAKPVFHELYELDMSFSNFLKTTFIDLKRIVKNKWKTG